jgi:hypothetical protein
MPEGREAFKLEAAGALTVGANKDRFQAPHGGDVTQVSAVVGTNPTGADLVFDILKNGTTIFPTGKPTIVAGASETADATVFKPDATAARFAKGDTLSLSVTQIGSTVAGSDADVTVEYTVL